MKLLTLALGAALILAIAGCSKSDKVTNANPWPPAGAIPEAEPNDVTPQNLGSLGTADQVVAGTMGTESDLDQYRIVLTQSADLHVELSWSETSDLNIGVMNPSGIMVNHQDTGQVPERCTLAGLPAGAYTLQVYARSGTGARYLMTLGPR